MRTIKEIREAAEMLIVVIALGMLLYMTLWPDLAGMYLYYLITKRFHECDI